MTKRKVSGGGGDMPSAHAGNKRLRAALQLVQGSAVMQVAPHAARSARIPPKRATSARCTLARVRVTRPTRPRRVRSPQRGGERGRARWVGGRLPEVCTVRAPRVLRRPGVVGLGVHAARRRPPPTSLGRGRAGRVPARSPWLSRPVGEQLAHNKPSLSFLGVGGGACGRVAGAVRRAACGRRARRAHARPFGARTTCSAGGGSE